MSVGKEILNQIKALDFWALGAWGAKDYVMGTLYDGKEGVKFKVKGTKTKRGSWCEITLNGNDYYDVRIYRIVNCELKVDFTETDISNDMLVKILDKAIG